MSSMKVKGMGKKITLNELYLINYPLRKLMPN